MKILYHIVSESDILMSNLSLEKVKEINSASYFYRYEEKTGTREEKKEYKNGWIYLSIDDKKITRKIFNRYMECLCSFYIPLIERRDDISNKYSTKIKRLKHNISNYNAKIQDELENIISSDMIPKRRDWKNSIIQLESFINEDLTLTARTLLHILKNVKLINAEMDVYDIMNSEEPVLNISEHSIRKVIDLSVQSFFLDLIDKKVSISIGDTIEKVKIDFPTFSVVLGHILDNAVKYTAENSILDISFSNDSKKVLVRISMTSIVLLQDEINDIFSENYSGYWATETGLNGHGIGMFYAKKLMELNNGEISFIPGKESYRLNGIPYANNIITITLNRAL